MVNLKFNVVVLTLVKTFNRFIVVVQPTIVVSIEFLLYKFRIKIPFSLPKSILITYVLHGIIIIIPQNL